MGERQLSSEIRRYRVEEITVDSCINDFTQKLKKVLLKGYTGKIELDCKSGIINHFNYRIRKGVEINGNG